MTRHMIEAPYAHKVANGRITRDKLITLRAAALREDPPRKYVEAILAEISRFISSMLAVPAERGRHTMCKSYGHIIRGSFYSYPPCCSDCGTRIEHPDQLRKATPKN